MQHALKRRSKIDMNNWNIVVELIPENEFEKQDIKHVFEMNASPEERLFIEDYLNST